MTPEKIIKELGGPAALGRLTGISKHTLFNYQQGYRKPPGPARLLLVILWVLHQHGLLTEITNEVRELKNE